MSSNPPPNLQDEINAINCALMKLRGEDVSFSAEEVEQAITTLQRMFNERVQPSS